MTEITIKDSTIIRISDNIVAAPKPISSIITGEYFVPFVECKFISDTIVVRDTIHKGGQTFYSKTHIYEDSVLTAQVSGINATLDWYRVKNRTEYRYVYKEKKVAENVKKWAFYINSEYCFTSAQQYLPIGAKLQYNGAKVEYYIKGGRDLISNKSYVALGANIPLIRF